MTLEHKLFSWSLVELWAVPNPESSQQQDRQLGVGARTLLAVAIMV